MGCPVSVQLDAGRYRQFWRLFLFLGTQLVEVEIACIYTFLRVANYANPASRPRQKI
jgi:hypothetical protein